MVLLVVPPTTSVHAPPAFANSQQNLRMDLQLLALGSLGRYQRQSGIRSSQMRIKRSHQKRKLKSGVLTRMVQTVKLTTSASTKDPTARQLAYFHKYLRKIKSLVPIQKYQATWTVRGTHQLERLLREGEGHPMGMSGSIPSWTRWLQRTQW